MRTKNCTFIQLLVKTWHSSSKNRKPSSENVLFDEKPNVSEYSNLFFSYFLKIEFDRFFWNVFKNNADFLSFEKLNFIDEWKKYLIIFWWLFISSSFHIFNLINFFFVSNLCLPFIKQWYQKKYWLIFIKHKIQIQSLFP